MYTIYIYIYYIYTLYMPYIYTIYTIYTLYVYIYTYIYIYIYSQYTSDVVFVSLFLQTCGVGIEKHCRVSAPTLMICEIPWERPVITNQQYKYLSIYLSIYLYIYTCMLCIYVYIYISYIHISIIYIHISIYIYVYPYIPVSHVHLSAGYPWYLMPRFFFLARPKFLRPKGTGRRWNCWCGWRAKLPFCCASTAMTRCQRLGGNLAGYSASLPHGTYCGEHCKVPSQGLKGGKAFCDFRIVH